MIKNRDFVSVKVLVLLNLVLYNFYMCGLYLIIKDMKFSKVKHSKLITYPREYKQLVLRRYVYTSRKISMEERGKIRCGSPFI